MTCEPLRPTMPEISIDRNGLSNVFNNLKPKMAPGPDSMHVKSIVLKELQVEIILLSVSNLGDFFN